MVLLRVIVVHIIYYRIALLIFVLPIKLCILYYRFKKCCYKKNNSDNNALIPNDENPVDDPNYVIVHPENFQA